MNRSMRAAAMAVAMLMTMSGAAQAGVWHAGAKAGLNLASFRGDFADAAGTKTKMGFSGGGFVVYQATPRFGIQAEAIYSMKGAKLVSQGVDENGILSGPFSEFVNLQYVEIPVLARVSLGALGPFDPYLVAGPTAGILLSARFESKNPAFLSAELHDTKNVDFGFAGGLGLMLRRNPYTFGIEGRYTPGFGDVYDIVGNLESINNVWSIALTASR